MRLICCDTVVSTTGKENHTYTLSPKIEGFLIPTKGTQCRKYFFHPYGNGPLHMKEKLEEQNNYITLYEILDQDKFWDNKGLFVKIIYEHPFNFEYPSHTTHHCVMDLYRRNNGHYRLIWDDMLDNFRGKLGKYGKNRDSYLLYEAANGNINELFSKKQLMEMFGMAEVTFEII